MSDDTMNRGARDRSRINLNQDYERHDWAKKFGVSEDELREAVRAVGDSADKVKDYLGHRKHVSHPSRG